jgi:hypothetical protein
MSLSSPQGHSLDGEDHRFCNPLDGPSPQVT